MTAEKIFEAIAAYRTLFLGKEIEKREVPHDQYGPSPEHQLAHCHGMLGQMEEFLRDGHREKAMRWLCFIQSVL